MNVAPWKTLVAQYSLGFLGVNTAPWAFTESISRIRPGHQSPGISAIISLRLGYCSNTPWNASDQISRLLWYGDSMNRSAVPSAAGQDLSSPAPPWLVS